MSKIPGFNFKSRLKPPAVKCQPAAPTDEGPSRHGKHERSIDETNESNKHAAGRSHDGQIKSTSGRMPSSVQSRLGLNGVKGTSLHSQLPYSRESESSVRQPFKKKATNIQSQMTKSPQSGRQKLDDKIVKSPENQSADVRRNGGRRESGVPQPGHSVSSFSKGPQIKKKASCIPAPGQLTKKTSSLQNLSALQRKKTTGSLVPCYPRLNTSKSMQNLTPKKMAEQPDVIGGTRASRGANTETGMRQYRAARPKSMSSVQMTSKLQTIDSEAVAEKQAFAVPGNNENEKFGLRKPNTLRIPVAKPGGKCLPGPRVGIARFKSTSSEGGSRLPCPDASVPFRRTSSQNSETEELRSTDPLEDCAILQPSSDFRTVRPLPICSTELSSSDDISPAFGPLQSTPLSKNAPSITPVISGTLQSNNHKIAVKPIQCFKTNASVSKGTTLMEDDIEQEKDSVEFDASEKVLERTYEIKSDSYSIDDPPPGSETFTQESRANNTTFVQNTDNLYQIVYGLQDESSAGEEPDGTSVDHNTFDKVVVDGDSGTVMAIDGAAVSHQEEDVKDVKIEENIIDSFDLLNVTPPQIDVSTVSLSPTILDKVDQDIEMTGPGIKVDANFNEDSKEQLSMLPEESSSSQTFFRSTEITGIPSLQPENENIIVVDLEETHSSPKGGSTTSDTIDMVSDKPEQVLQSLVQQDQAEQGAKERHDIEATAEVSEREHDRRNQLDTESNTEIDPTELLMSPGRYGANREIDKQKSMTLPLARSRNRSLSHKQRGIFFHDRKFVDSLSPGLLLKPPSRNLFALEDESGNVTLDKWSYIQLQHEIKAMKTALLKLKRNLQEVDVWSSLSVTSYPKNHTYHHEEYTLETLNKNRQYQRPKSYSDVNSWTSTQPLPSLKIAKLQSSVDHGVDEAMEAQDDVFGNRTVEERRDVLEQLRALEKVKNDLLHELDMKNNTIHLLQTQLEGNHFREEKDELLEENIILHEEVQRLTEELEVYKRKSMDEVVNTRESDCTPSIKDGFAKQLDSSSKAKVGLLQRMYSYDKGCEGD